MNLLCTKFQLFNPYRFRKIVLDGGTDGLTQNGDCIVALRQLQGCHKKLQVEFPDFLKVRAPQAKILKNQDLFKSAIHRQIFFKFPDFFRILSSSFNDHFRVFPTFSGYGNPVIISNIRTWTTNGSGCNGSYFYFKNINDIN